MISPFRTAALSRSALDPTAQHKSRLGDRAAFNRIDGTTVVPIMFSSNDRSPDMQILDIPENMPRKTVRPNGDWLPSARCKRELTLRDEMVAAARDSFDVLSDRDLRSMIATMLDADLRAMGGGDPPRGFPKAATMTRDKILDYLAEGAIGYVPDIEVVYPGAIDPTA